MIGVSMRVTPLAFKHGVATLDGGSTAPRGNVGQVRDPELVRACGVEVALHEVHRASAGASAIKCW